MKQRAGKKNCPRKGQTVVEFALILPVLLLIILGIMELGRLLFIYVAVTSASREGARYGSSTGFVDSKLPRYLDCEGIRAAANNLAILTGIKDEDIEIVYDAGGSPTIANCDTSDVEDLAEIELGNRVVVTVEGSYAPIVPIPFAPLPESFTIESTTARTIVKDVSVGP